MQTIIIDIFNPVPEDLSKENVIHDIIGTSEAGLQLCLHYGSGYRFYFCEDIDQELRVQQWHSQSRLANKHHVMLLSCDNDDLPGELIEPSNEIRLIINGQGYLGNVVDLNDHIAGFTAIDFIELLDNFFKIFNIGSKRQLKELVVFSCAMARSKQFVDVLKEKFSNYSYPLDIILFKEIITFSSGEVISFFENGEVKSESLEKLSKDTGEILRSNIAGTKRKRL